MDISPEEARQLLNDYKSKQPLNDDISPQEARQLLQQHTGQQENKNAIPLSKYLTGGDRAALTGLLNLGRGVPNAAIRLAQLFKIPGSENISPFTEEQFGIPNIISPEERQSSIGKANEFLGGALPLAALPMGGAATWLGRLGKSAATGAALGPIYSPDASLPESAALGAALGAGFSGLGSAARGIFGKMGGTNTAEQVAQIRGAEVPGQEVPLAEAIESPYLKWFQSSVLGQLPFSSMKKKYLEIDKGNIERLENSLGNKSELEVQNIPNEIQEELRNKYKNNISIHHKNYNEVADIANKNNIKVNSNDYGKVLREKFEESKSLREEGIKNPESATDKETFNFLKEQLEKEGGKQSKRNIDYHKATLLDKTFNNIKKKASEEGLKKKYSLYNDLQSALRKDMNDSVEEAGVPELSEKWKQARNFYKDEIVPLEDKDILPFITNRKLSEQIIPKFFKKTKIEQAQLSNKLLKHLSPEQQENIGLYLLTSGGSKNEAKDIAQIYGSLGNQTKKLLFPDKQRKEIESSMEIAKALGGQKGQMFVPKTGYQAIGGLGVLGAALTAPAILPKVAAGGAILGSANLLTKALTNKKSRDFLISRYLKSISKDNKSRRDLTKYAYPALETITGGQ